MSKSNDNRRTAKPPGGKVRKDTNKSRDTDTRSGYRESTPHVGHKPKKP